MTNPIQQALAAVETLKDFTETVPTNAGEHRLLLALLGDIRTALQSAAQEAAELEQLRKLEAALLALPANCVLNYCGDMPAFLESAAELSL